MTDAEVQEYLRANGYPEHVVRGGKAGLVRGWREFVEQVERGYTLGLEDYRNDLDVRAILTRAGVEDEDLRALDDRLKKMLTSDVRVWQNDAGDFGYPRNAGAELISDLRSEGLVK
jgi:hypothetical protein